MLMAYKYDKLHKSFDAYFIANPDAHLYDFMEQYPKIAQRDQIELKTLPEMDTLYRWLKILRLRQKKKS